jgi:hypothetical protein
MAGRIQLKRGTAAQWTASNPILAAGEPGVERDTGRQKIGDGTTAWNSLPYVDAVGLSTKADTSALTAGLATKVDTSTLTTDGDILTRSGGSVTRTTRANLAADAAFSGRLSPAVFFVDWYLPTGVTPTTATSAQTLAAYNAARAAAAAVRGIVKFTPGQTYQIDDTFIIDEGMTFDCTGATLRKRSTTGYQTPLIVNGDWANGDPDITVIAHGSVWDMNGRVLLGGSGRPYGGLGDCAHFQNCDRLRIIGRPFIKDASKFALTIGNADDIEIDGAIFDTRSDGFHGYGPMRRAWFGTFSGRTGDDFFALTISDYPAQMDNLTANGETVLAGDFEDIRIEALLIDNAGLPTGGASTGSGFSLLGNSSTFRHNRIHVGTIAGRSKMAWRAENDAILVDCRIGSVTVDKIEMGSIGSAQTGCRIAPTSAESITIGEIVMDAAGTAQPLNIVSGTIEHLSIGKYTHRTGINALSSFLVDTAAVVRQIDIGTVLVAFGGTTGRFFQSQSSSPLTLNIGTMRLVDPAATGWGWGFFVNGTGAVTVNLTNAVFAGITQVVRLDNASTLRLFASNMTVDNCFILFNLNSATTTMRFVASNIRQVASSDRAVTKTAGALYSANGASYRVPVDTRIDNSQSIAGDIVYNSIAGTTPLGLVQYNGTAWVAV